VPADGAADRSRIYTGYRRKTAGLLVLFVGWDLGRNDHTVE
jgi:hypothetical protein